MDEEYGTVAARILRGGGVTQRFRPVEQRNARLERAADRLIELRKVEHHAPEGWRDAWDRAWRELRAARDA